jgi:hypothetical protein
MIVPHYEWREKEKNRFVLRGDFSTDLSRAFGAYSLRVGGREVARIEGRRLTVWAGFEWDGCTPNQLFGITWLSVPSPPQTAAPSLVHDILRQFCRVPGAPWDCRFADDEFDRLLRTNRFLLRPIYVAGVGLDREFGPIPLLSPDVEIHFLPN